MDDFLLLAGPATQPQRLMRYLGRHPEVAAIRADGLSQRLYEAARADVRRYRSTAADAGLLDTVSHGRAGGGAAFMRLYAEARAAFGARAVVVHEPAGPAFPFQEPPPVSLLVLVRTAESAAAVIGARGVERVVAAARDGLAAFKARVDEFAMPPERVLTVEEDRLDGDPAGSLGEICRMLGVAADDRIVAGLMDHVRIDARTTGGA